ncbi:MAG: hypothetical protein AB7C97_09645 [Oscillospiraceae bacterium]
MKAKVCGGWAYCPGCGRKICRVKGGAQVSGLEFKCRSCRQLFDIEIETET